MFDKLNTMKCNAIKYFASRKKYNNTVRELTSLTDHELNDIGISRSMIRSVAMELYHP
jgi:uncharacterized protein YjiS (DUF1127 family)